MISRPDVSLHPTRSRLTLSSCTRRLICRDKYSYIKLFTPGTDSRTADGYLYQNRNYGDLFLIENKVAGVAMNAEAVDI